MKVVIVENPKNDSLIQQLISLYLVFKDINQDEIVSFDLSKLRFLFPLLTLPISAYINKTKSEFSNPVKESVVSYLRTINFPEGIATIPEFQKVLSYIPIGVLEKNDLEKREKLESCFAEIVYKVLKSNSAAQNAIYYPLAELVANIFEHSKENIGYVFAQYYPKKKFVDLCIVDCGRGLVKTYKEEKKMFFTDKEAIEQVLSGFSTKLESGRGYGVRTSKRVICEGLKGDFVLISGTASLCSFQDEEMILSLSKFYWQGVIIAYRIPQPINPIDITPYLSG